MIRLLSKARSHLAMQSRGLSEQIEALVHHLSCVRTKVDRIQAARGEDLEALESELAEGWTALEGCAARIQDKLERSARTHAQGR